MTGPAARAGAGSGRGRADVGHQDLPRTDRVPHPRRAMLHGLRPAFHAGVGAWWNLELAGSESFPTHGPVVVVANHIGFIDGPLLAILSPRPVHALTKQEMFKGPMSTFLTGAGQIPLRRTNADPNAVRLALKVVRDGGVVGVFPEGTRGGGELDHLRGGAAYLALATGATVQPVIFLGTRLAGGSHSSLPPRGSRLAMTFGAPLEFDGHTWPRRKDEVAAATDRIGAALRETLAEAELRTGMSLPGPIPRRNRPHD